MSAENARVFLAENVASFRMEAKGSIEGSSHKVVIEAATLEEALDSIKKAKKLGVNVAVVDENLTWGYTSGYEGRTIARKLKAKILGIKIISLSHVKPRRPYGDVHVYKGYLDTLGRVITQL